MPPDPGLLSILRALAERERVDWDGLESSRADGDPVRGIARELQVVTRITQFHRALQDAPDPADASSWSMGTDSEDARVDAALDTPALWGCLTLLERVGQGSFADVFRAWDTRLEREVALKLLRARDLPPEAGSRNPSGGMRDESTVINEARLLARVRHRNVVTVYGVERIDGRVGIWTEFIRGVTLAELVRQQGPLSADEASAIGIDLCRAVAAVHQAGLLHRDIKAQNVMREQGGRIVLMDLGAGREQTSATIESDNGLTGTPLYLAPEAWQRSAAAPQTDIYSLGVLLFHLVTGTYPVRGTTLSEVRDAHRAGQRTLLADARPDLPHAFTDVVERALAVNPSERYESAGAFETALKQAHSVSAIAVAPITPAARIRVRPRALWLAAIAAVFAGAFLLDAGGARSRWRTLRGASPAVPPAVAGPEAQPTIRKVRIPQRWVGRPSRDGRYFPYVDANGDLQIWELTTGRSRRPIEKDTGETIASPVMSPRGDRVAYATSTGAGAWELRVVHADGRWPTIVVARQSAYRPMPLDWSRDGQNILCRLDQHNGTADLVLIPAGGGGPHVLHTFTGRAPSNARLSPDGRFVVYRLRRDSQSGREDVYVVGIDGVPPRTLVVDKSENPYAYDRVPAWTPDGKGVLFLQESAKVREAQDGWILPIADGVPQGDAFQVLTTLGAPSGIGLTDDGALYYLMPHATRETYIAPIDLTGDVVRGAPSRVSTRSIGGHPAAVWSPDGASIAFYTELPNPVPGHRAPVTLTVRDMATGVERTVATPKIDPYAPRWTTDSRSVILKAADRESGRRGLFRVDVQTGETSVVVWTNQNPAYFHCSPDGRDLFYVDARGIVARDLSSGDERIAVHAGARSTIEKFGISPDGRSIAFVRRTTGGDSASVALEVQPVNGAPRELLRVQAPNDLRFQLWTPDGRDILFTRWTRGRGEPFRLWRIAASGGKPRDTHFKFTDAMDIGSLSPDGSRNAYTEQLLLWELWITPNWRLAAASQ